VVEEGWKDFISFVRWEIYEIEKVKALLNAFVSCKHFRL
jgi:hypothetical protein